MSSNDAFPSRPDRPRVRAYRRDLAWLAALLHRLSGIALAVFLPVHFLVLGLAIEGSDRFDSFLAWTARPDVKLAEAVLVALFVGHLLGGLRLLAVDRGDTRWQASLVAASLTLSLLAALVFVIVAI